MDTRLKITTRSSVNHDYAVSVPDCHSSPHILARNAFVDGDGYRFHLARKSSGEGGI